jgi:hypothetical protein
LTMAAALTWRAAVLKVENTRVGGAPALAVWQKGNA